MSDLDFTVSYLDTNGEKHDKEIHLDSQPYKKSIEEKMGVLLQNYPPDQAETHILNSKKDYIQSTVAKEFGEGTPVKYDIAEMINALDKDIKGIK